MIAFIRNIYYLSLLLLREEMREPGWLFWSITFPFIIMFALFLQTTGSLSPVLFPIMLSFVSVVTAIRSTGAYLVGRREASFLQAFVSFPLAQKRYILAQVIAGFIFAGVIVAVFGVVSSFFFKEVSIFNSINQIARALGVVFFAIFAGSILNLIPLKFQTVMGLVTSTYAPMLLLTFAELIRFPDNMALIMINTMNPVAVGTAIIGGTPISWLVLTIWPIACFGLFGATITWFNLETRWDK